MDIASGSAIGTYRKATLDNGLRVVTCEMPHTRSVSTGIFIGAGSRYESAEQAGISHFVEHMAFKGTHNRPTPEEISGSIEGVGGVLNAGTEQEMTLYWCKVAQPYFGQSLDLLVDMVRNPLFEPESVEKERMVVIDELNMTYDYPHYRVDALIDELLWPDHPLGRDIGGTRESVAGITRDAMVDYLGQYYSPSNVVISVAGSVSHDDVVSQVGALCDGWSTPSPAGWSTAGDTPPGPQLRLEYRKTEQAHMSIAVPGVALDHPDRYALDLLSVVLGEGMSSRLFLELRERRGLAYDIHSGVTHFLDCGALVITAGVDPKRVYDATETIMEQVAGMRDAVPEEELERAKRLAVGRMLLRLEDTRAVSGWMGNQELLTERILETDEVIERVAAVTPDEVRRVANEFLFTEALSMAVVGPCRGRKRLERSLRL